MYLRRIICLLLYCLAESADEATPTDATPTDATGLGNDATAKLLQADKSSQEIAAKRNGKSEEAHHKSLGEMSPTELEELASRWW